MIYRGGDKPIRIALVGNGRWGKIYQKVIESMADSGVGLSYIVSRNSFESQNSARVVKNWQDIVTNDDIDGVVIATPPEVHLEIAQEFLNAGKCVLIEKPLTMCAKELKSFQVRVMESGWDSRILVNHIHLFNPGFLAFVSNLSRIGKISHISTSGGSWGPFRKTYSSLWDYAPHDISMVLSILNTMPVSLKAKMIMEKDTPDGLGQNFEANLIFPEEITVSIQVGSLYTEKVRTIEARGSLGRLVFDDNSTYGKLTFEGNDIPVTDLERPLNRVIRKFSILANGKQIPESGLALASKVTTIIDNLDRGL